MSGNRVPLSILLLLLATATGRYHQAWYNMPAAGQRLEPHTSLNCPRDQWGRCVAEVTISAHREEPDPPPKRHPDPHSQGRRGALEFLTGPVRQLFDDFGNYGREVFTRGQSRSHLVHEPDAYPPASGQRSVLRTGGVKCVLDDFGNCAREVIQSGPTKIVILPETDPDPPPSGQRTAHVIRPGSVECVRDDFGNCAKEVTIRPTEIFILPETDPDAFPNAFPPGQRTARTENRQDRKPMESVFCPRACPTCPEGDECVRAKTKGISIFTDSAKPRIGTGLDPPPPGQRTTSVIRPITLVPCGSDDFGNCLRELIHVGQTRPETDSDPYPEPDPQFAG